MIHARVEHVTGLVVTPYPELHTSYASTWWMADGSLYEIMSFEDDSSLWQAFGHGMSRVSIAEADHR